MFKMRVEVLLPILTFLAGCELGHKSTQYFMLMHLDFHCTNLCRDPMAYEIVIE